MKGLVIKELLTILDMYKKNLILILVVYAGIGIMTGNAFFCAFPVMMSSFYVMGTFAVEQNTGWDNYARTLPLDTKDIVGGRYLAFLICLALMTLLSLVLGGICIAMGKIVPEEFAGTLAALGVISILMCAIMFPTSWKFGVEKARTFIMIFYVGIAALFVIFATRGMGDGSGLAGIIAFMEKNRLLITVLVLAVPLGLLLISYPISCRLYDSNRK